MTYRFEEEDFKSLYILEDYYCTNPFCDCNHVTISLCDKEDDDNRFSFLLNFNKTQGTLPNHPELTDSQKSILSEFMEEVTDEMIILFKQRYMEAKAYGESNPMSYLMFESGRYVNYMEMFPREKQLLDFKFKEEKHFAEDAYELDPRNDNKSVQLTFYKFDPAEDRPPPIFSYNYYFNEKQREQEEAKLEPANSELLMEFVGFIPNLNDILKKRYKEAKQIGEELLKTSPKLEVTPHKVPRNEMCPCGSGKKFKKCCGLKLN
jgi:hypothetical protein